MKETLAVIVCPFNRTSRAKRPRPLWMIKSGHKILALKSTLSQALEIVEENAHTAVLLRLGYL